MFANAWFLHTSTDVCAGVTSRHMAWRWHELQKSAVRPSSERNSLGPDRHRSACRCAYSTGSTFPGRCAPPGSTT
ncbi:Uncharacterised protein [Mycobacteroides abscessus subsp. abscessus]|nr:Uncharacterised protein [Mycobacteroides abscessus subsp. abscessus]